MKAVPHRQGRAQRASRIASARRVGFTLIELLTVIAILGLLISMIAPSIQKVRQGFKVDQTKTYLHQLTMGIENFKTDLGYYPPSDGSFPKPSGASGQNLGTGAAGLVQCMWGYLDKNADGQNGNGFRIIRAGKPYGPYVSDRMPLIKAGGQSPVFADAFGFPVLYYRWNSNAYNGGDNNDGPPQGIMSYVTNTDPKRSSDHQYYRKDYVLISRGPDTQWAKSSELTKDTRKVDDIANFSFYVKGD